MTAPGGFLSPDASPFGSLLDPAQLEALKNQAKLGMGMDLLNSATAPAMRGERPGVFASLAHALQSTNWPGMLGQAGQQAMAVGQYNIKREEQQGIEQIIRQNHVPESATAEAKMEAMRNISVQLANLGTPQAIDAADKFAKLHAQFKETMPSPHAIHWIEGMDPATHEAYHEAHDPVTGKAILGDDGKPMRLPGRAPLTAITANQQFEHQQKLDSSLDQQLDPIMKNEGEYKMLLANKPDLKNPASVALWMNHAKDLMRASGSAGGGEAASMLGLMLEMLEIKAKGFAGKQIESEDFEGVVKQVEAAMKANHTLGYHVWHRHQMTAADNGYVSRHVQEYEPVWGVPFDESRSAEQPKLGNSKESEMDKEAGLP
jgi:hypothetical protein